MGGAVTTAKRGRGRPKVPPEQRRKGRGIGLSAQELERLQRLAERDDVSESEVVRRALVLYEQATAE
jgi:hypothetical protein